MHKYIITRKNVYAGVLVKIDRESVDFNINSSLVCRGMLFSLDECYCANDLIYTTPTNYPILGITSSEFYDTDFVVKNYVKLDKLLKHLKYNYDLSQKDLNKIYRKLINSDFWLKHNSYKFSNGNNALPIEIYKNLEYISSIKNGKPSKEEIGYSLIKKKH